MEELARYIDFWFLLDQGLYCFGDMAVYLCMGFWDHIWDKLFELKRSILKRIRNKHLLQNVFLLSINKIKLFHWKKRVHTFKFHTNKKQPFHILDKTIA